MCGSGSRGVSLSCAACNLCEWFLIPNPAVGDSGWGNESQPGVTVASGASLYS